MVRFSGQEGLSSLRSGQIDGIWSVTVGDKLQVKVASKHGLEAGEELHLRSTQVVIEASEGLTLKGWRFYHH